MVETRKTLAAKASKPAAPAKKAAAKKAAPAKKAAAKKVDPYEGTDGPHKALNLPIGGIETDEGGRPVVDEGGRPVRIDK